MRTRNLDLAIAHIESRARAATIARRMTSSASLLAAIVIAGSVACSSSSFDVAGEGTDATSDASEDTSVTPPGDTSEADTGAAADTSVPLDSSGPLDAGPLLDTGNVLDTGKKDTAPVDTGCTAGTTAPCECGGYRPCTMSGTFGECMAKCPTAPSRYLCFYGKDGCTVDSCFDSNNCPAKCACGSNPGTTCALTDPCWGQVCNGYVCPS